MLETVGGLVQTGGMDANGRIALIVGASSEGGMGEAVARRMARDGYDVIVAGRRREPLDRLCADIGGRALTCDITDEDSIVALVAGAGKVDVAINAAGTTLAQSILKIDRAQIEAQWTMHVTANLLFLKHVVPAMPAGGAVVLFSSVTGTLAGQGLAAYGAAKAGLDHVVRVAALEFGPHGVRVNAVAPGFSKTPMTNSFLSIPAFDRLYRRESALGALVTPTQIAATVAYLAGPDCFASGEILHVSGGAQLCRLPRRDELYA